VQECLKGTLRKDAKRSLQSFTFFSFYFSFPLSAGPVCERMVKRFHNLTNLPSLRVRDCDREPRKTSATQRTQTNQTTVAPHPTPAGVLKNYFNIFEGRASTKPYNMPALSRSFKHLD
jgi:hypothetical protein